MNYIESNLKELKISGVLDYHSKGIKGHGITVAILENTLNSSLKMFKGKVKTLEKKEGKLVEVINRSKSAMDSHAQKEVDILLQVLPDVDTIYCLPTGFSNIGGIIEGSIFDSLQLIIDKKIDIVSSSIGGVNHPKVIDMIREAKSQGTVFFNAIGNSGRDATDVFVNTGEFIDVGSGSENGKHGYSSTGPKLEVISYVLDVRDSENEERTFSITGTSFSTPMLAGCIGLLKSYLKSKGKVIFQDEVLELIKEYAMDLGEEGRDDLTGYGLFVLPSIEKLDISKCKNINQKESVDMVKDYFKDDNGQWHEKYNNRLASLGIVNGYEDGTIKADNNISRGEVNKIACALLDTVAEMIAAAK